MSRFSKYSGAGNDFVIVRAEELGLADPAVLARRICPRPTGVGVDGLILVRSLSEDRVRIRFFNPDGSEFGTCGNGSRCAARYAYDRGLVGDGRFGLVTDDGEVHSVVDPGSGLVALDYRLGAFVEREIEVDLAGSRVTGWLVQIGTPHFVIALPELPDGSIDALCRPVRLHPELGDEGANVDLVTPTGPDSAAIRTFERGVEAETLACGSGSMAATLAFQRAGLAGESMRLVTRSGETLQVELLPEDVIRLAGPARHIFDGVLPDDLPDASPDVSF
jgi:diaminopimelate epimerase